MGSNKSPSASETAGYVAGLPPRRLKNSHADCHAIFRICTGFGLRCPQTVHSVARSAGISDLSASISGSTNPLNVCRAVCAALWGGAHPVGLGDGLGGSARRKDLGQGVKSIEQIEVERGRRFRVISK